MAELDPRLAELAWPYNETDDLNMVPSDLIVLAEDAQTLIDDARSRALPSVDDLAQIIRTADGDRLARSDELAQHIINALTKET